MTHTPHRNQLTKLAAEVEPTLLDPHSDRSEWWREQAYHYAGIADALLTQWREDHPKRPHDGPVAD